MTATSRSGLDSAIAMAARSPAAPPPTRSTSWAAATAPSLTPELLVAEDLAVVVHDHPVDAAVVELLLALPTAARELEVLGHEALLVLGHEGLAVPHLSARRASSLEATDG